MGGGAWTLSTGDPLGEFHSPFLIPKRGLYHGDDRVAKVLLSRVMPKVVPLRLVCILPRTYNILSNLRKHQNQDWS